MTSFLKPPATPKGSRLPGNNSHTGNYMYCTVMSIDGNQAWVRDQFQNLRNIPLTRIMGKGSQKPEPGEHWIITSLFGDDWIFAICINPKSTGSVVYNDIQYGSESYTIPNGQTSILEASITFPTPFASIPYITANPSGSFDPPGDYWFHAINIAKKTTTGFTWRPFITTGNPADTGDQHNTFDWIAVGPVA